VILPTSNPRLSLVPAGVIPVARRPAIAASTALAGVLDELEARFDHLLLDLPPVLASSEAMNLSQFADAYVLVVQQGATAEAQVEAALEEMRGAEALGVILNRYDTHIPRRLRKLVGT
jgi:Mrp family chromosome partitioning ATPase